MENVVYLANQINDLLMESSSSSSSEDEFLQPRVKHLRVDNFENICDAYSEENFKKNFRMNRESTEYLINRYSVSPYYTERCYRGGRNQTSPKVQVLSFLWFAANKTTLREVANLFNLAISKQQGVVMNVINFIVDEVAKEIITFPSEEAEKQRIAKEFEEICGFPNVLGCIDGSYISIRKPKNKIRSTYSNRHDSLSITLQGISDARCKFLDVFTGIPSKIHDSRVLKLSFIGKDLSNLCSPKYHILGDSAYPLREYLLTPYRDYGNLTEEENQYNTKFCATRVKIENAFGMLKCRFRQLMRLDFHCVETMSKFIIACCTLHNICIDRQDFQTIDEIFNAQPTSSNNETTSCNDICVRESDLLQLGQTKRDYMKNML